MKYKITSAVVSNIGCVRSNNEDNYYFNYRTLPKENIGMDTALPFTFTSFDNISCAIFDGIGGEENGELASFIAAKTLNKYIKDNANKTFSWNEYIELSNQKIVANMNNGHVMGTTVAGCLFANDNIIVCNLGDSKIFGFNNDNLVQLSIDHTDQKIQERLKVNRNSSYKLTQYLGIPKSEMVLKPHIKSYQYSDYKTIIICSDGLTDMVSTTDIKDILNENLSTKEKTNKLVQLALDNGGIDNITVMVFDIKKDGFKMIIIFPLILILLIALSLLIKLLSNKRAINDSCPNTLIVGNNCGLEIPSTYKLILDNDNLNYKNGKLYGLQEGITHVTIYNNKNNVELEKIIKIFPK